MDAKALYRKAYSLIRYTHFDHDYDYAPPKAQYRDILAETRLLPNDVLGAAYKSHQEQWLAPFSVPEGKYQKLYDKKYAPYYRATLVYPPKPGSRSKKRGKRG